MISSEVKFGLVLTGGGAKGAYHVGALQYLAELGFSPHIIAGTSIGALNGAVLASQQPFDQAVLRLSELWEQLGQANILRPNSGAVLPVLSYVAQTLVPTFSTWIMDFLVKQQLLKGHTVIFDPEPIERLLKETIDLKELQNGTELWVTVFPSFHIPGLNYDWLIGLIDLLRAQTGTSAHWLRAQDCKDEETLHSLLLASAAIPLAFPKRTVNGQHYVDGGLADNVPLGALAKQGCTHAIVIHLQNGATWSRHDFPQQTVVEIRPEQPIGKFDTPIVDDISTLLDFSPDRITDLKQRGYEDARRCMEPIIHTFRAVSDSRRQQASLVESTQKLLSDPPLP
ncbi:MAG: patatin-like phospholipase family protein [Elainellaceae cyanobacterium]